MNKFYFFKSSYPKDEITSVTIFTKSLKKAYSLAFKAFAKYNCKGVPQLLAI